MQKNNHVIDFHSHAGNWGRYTMDDNIDSYVHVMDKAGVDIACINCVFHGDSRIGNDMAETFVSKYPSRFRHVAYVNPHYPENVIQELERCFDQLGSLFIKIYPDYFQKANDDPAYFPAYEFANDRKLAIMMHAAFPFDPPGLNITERFTNLSNRFPNIKWVLAHAGGGAVTTSDQKPFFEHSASGEAAKEIPQVYLETCSSATAFNCIEAAVDAAGEDKVLFGTDMTLMDARQQIAKITTSTLSEDIKIKILGENAKRLLNLQI